MASSSKEVSSKMPHATAVTNGNKSSSQFISSLTSLPVVSEGIDTFKSNPIGKKSLEIADGAYDRFGKPVMPYLETPYSYAKPYVQKADELADSGLHTVKSHFPIVEKDSSTIIDTTKSYVFWPYSYVSKTYNDEYQKTASHKQRGGGLITFGMAVVSTELKIASDFFQTVADFLGPKYEDTKQKGQEYAGQLKETAEQYQKAGADKLAEMEKIGAQKKEEAKKAAEQTKKDAEKTKEDAKAKSGAK